MSTLDTPEPYEECVPNPSPFDSLALVNYDRILYAAGILQDVIEEDKAI
jgi:hypothetical protein